MIWFIVVVLIVGALFLVDLNAEQKERDSQDLRRSIRETFDRDRAEREQELSRWWTEYHKGKE